MLWYMRGSPSLQDHMGAFEPRLEIPEEMHQAQCSSLLQRTQGNTPLLIQRQHTGKALQNEQAASTVLTRTDSAHNR